MKAYSAWYDRQTGELTELEKDSYSGIPHIRGTAAMMADEYRAGAPELQDSACVWVAWDVRGVDEYLGVFPLDDAPVSQSDLDNIERLASKIKKRWQ